MNDPIASSLQRSASLEFEEHASFLRSLARRLVKDAASADDLAQDTLLAAITSSSRRTDLTGPEARPWLARVLRRKAAKSGAEIRGAASARGLWLDLKQRTPLPRSTLGSVSWGTCGSSNQRCKMRSWRASIRA